MSVKHWENIKRIQWALIYLKKFLKYSSKLLQFQVTDRGELYRLVYYGGVEPELRAEVWPYLLGHYKFGSAPEERGALDTEQRQQYEKVSG